jgi:hypothetical protein
MIGVRSPLLLSDLTAKVVMLELSEEQDGSH